MFFYKFYRIVIIVCSGSATPERAKSNDLAGRSTAVAPPCRLLCFGNSVNRKEKCYHIGLTWLEDFLTSK